MSDKNFKVKNGLTIQGTVDTLIAPDNAGGLSLAGTISATSFVGSGAGLTGISSYSAPTLGSTPIGSGATVTSIDGLTLSSPTFTGTVAGVTKSHVGLGNVDNTADTEKPVSTATQTALDLKASLTGAAFTGAVTGIDKVMVGLDNVDNTSDANKPVSTATQTALDLKVDESLFDAKGDILVASADNTPAKLAVGTNGYLLTANSSATNGVEWAAAPISLPSQSGNNGKYLTTNGTTASWATVSGGNSSAPAIHPVFAMA